VVEGAVCDVGGTMISTERGFSLLETLFALGILTIVSAGVLPLAFIAVTTTENQGHLAARTTEYAQDKLEQLLALPYSDSITDTRVFPSAAAGGSGLLVGGSSNPAAPVNLYVDYLDVDGNLFPPAAGVPATWYYQRVWLVETPRANLKQITVTAIVRASAAGGIGRVPQSTVSALKTFPF
jgi:prepilin-type N-terminal cleavage/methylation domain-containing protein